MNALTLLKDDHAKVKKILSKLEKTTERATKTRRELVSQLEREIKIHAKIEEELFYPAFKKAVEKKKEDRELFFEANEEHHVVDLLLPELKGSSPDSEEFGAKASVLKELIEHHIEEEETEMFKKARAKMSAQLLNKLGEMMEARKRSLEAQWDNPVLRPLKKVGGLIDKMVPTSVKNAKGAAIAKVMPKDGGKSQRKSSRSDTGRERRA